LAADVLQIAIAPIFGEGFASPFNDALDLVVAAVLIPAPRFSLGPFAGPRGRSDPRAGSGPDLDRGGPADYWRAHTPLVDHWRLDDRDGRRDLDPALDHA